MTADLPIRCTCGALRGVARAVSASSGNRCVCYCDDCQSFAHFLGRASEILDARGGTEIFQMSPAHFSITQGADHLACMRLTPKGLVRWYADCCKTPIGNSLMTSQVPFVGLIHACFDQSPGTPSPDEVLGPVRAHVFTRFAKGDRERFPLRDSGKARAIARFAALLLRARLRGDHKASPFFDPNTGAPRPTPRVLSEPELREVVRARDAR